MCTSAVKHLNDGTAHRLACSFAEFADNKTVIWILCRQAIATARPCLTACLNLDLKDEDVASSSASDPEDGEDNLTKARFCDRAESTDLSFKLFGFDTSSLP